MIVVGNISCKEVHWEHWSTEGGEETWGIRLLSIAMDNFMWIAEDTRFRDDNTPARLDLVFTKAPDVVGEIIYKCYLGKSNNVNIKFKVLERREEARDKLYRRQRFNYTKADFGSLRKFNEETDWSMFNKASNIWEIWVCFLRLYNDVERYMCQG